MMKISCNSLLNDVLQCLILTNHQLGGIVVPNDGLCHMDENGRYTHSTIQVSQSFVSIDESISGLHWSANHSSPLVSQSLVSIVRPITGLHWSANRWSPFVYQLLTSIGHQSLVFFSQSITDLHWSANHWSSLVSQSYVSVGFAKLAIIVLCNPRCRTTRQLCRLNRNSRKVKWIWYSLSLIKSWKRTKSWADFSKVPWSGS